MGEVFLLLTKPAPYLIGWNRIKVGIMYEVFVFDDESGLHRVNVENITCSLNDWADCWPDSIFFEVELVVV